MRILIFLFVLSLSTQIMGQHKTLYDFSAKTIDGNNFDFSSLKGKKVLIVNTASECGFTGQYKKLQALYDMFGGELFEIIGFPANNFKNQEPGTNEEIAAFCEKNYGVTFQMMEKISVKGDDIHPLYKWLTNKDENGVLNTSVKWNFQKFMVDENGQLVDYLYPTTSPTGNKIEKWLNE
jgi:glutathione peroxidase